MGSLGEVLGFYTRTLNGLMAATMREITGPLQGTDRARFGQGRGNVLGDLKGSFRSAGGALFKRIEVWHGSGEVPDRFGKTRQ